ncbi:flavo protein WrbA [Coemansia reversa NRRL 1564]|uniref:Flavo protein WrbA n=1 Tax=Coemansia reversa (strain ATCC 12441 / NRRL 1564) TaxID=763665 RepID=A0A2G5B2B6_COERN|nr:flavo protein WrbA [Coemansia reversa NRRL 1564]|eukprot:PIA13158.1 flavo protein WrbA [Coemansia reversa NRRL 1564]
MAKPKVFVIYYSTYGHVHTLSQSIVKGVLKPGTVDVELYQIAETLSQDTLEKMHAAPKANVPEITADKLVDADGILLGFPTRFGTAPAQVKALFDATGKLWASKALQGKSVGLFFSTGSQHGGQESTAYTFLPHLAHHGMIYVPLGYSSLYMFDNDTIVGGSAWGSGVIAGPDGSLQPTYKELEIAEIQGEKFAQIVTKLVAGTDREDVEQQQESAAAAPEEVAVVDSQSPAASAPAQLVKPATDSTSHDDTAAAADSSVANKEKGSAVRKLVAKFKKVFK